MLLFEDEEDVRASLKMVLKKSGYIVNGCADGGEYSNKISEF